MKIVVAMDSWKGSLTSMEAGNAVKDGILLAMPEAEVVVCPLADGGEGTIEALTAGLGGTIKEVSVMGPLGQPVASYYGLIREQKLAIMEMATVAGLTLIPENQRDPMQTTTYGVGEMILDGLEEGCRHFLMGIGGSGTNDGGVGMLQALGYQCVTAEGADVPLGGRGLQELAKIDGSKVKEELAQCTFEIACDVDNPLCGERGASAVYGPQKGATEKMVSALDEGLHHFAEIAMTSGYRSESEEPGAGAAGGLGFAFRTFLHGELCPGAEVVMKATQLEKKLADASIVVTGEGRLDGQTSRGKAPAGVAKLAKNQGAKVIAFAGSVGKDARCSQSCGIDAYFSVLREVTSLEEAMKPEVARENLVQTVEQVFRIMS